MAKRKRTNKKWSPVQKRKPIKKETPTQILKRTITNLERALIEENRKRANVQEELERNRPLPFYWTCADGRRLRPCEMDEQHLRNTVSFLQRTLVKDFGTVPYLNRTLPRILALGCMIEECNRRGLEV